MPLARWPAPPCDDLLLWCGSSGATRRWLVPLLPELIRNGLTRVCTDGASDLRTRTHNFAMDCTGNAVMDLDIELGQLVVLDDASVRKVTQRRLVHNVSHSETLDRLVLCRLARAAIAEDLTRVVTSVTVASMVAPFHLRLFIKWFKGPRNNIECVFVACCVRRQVGRNVSKCTKWIYSSEKPLNARDLQPHLPSSCGTQPASSKTTTSSYADSLAERRRRQCRRFTIFYLFASSVPTPRATTGDEIQSKGLNFTVRIAFAVRFDIIHVRVGCVLLPSC
jgi:hypothetical protein